MQEGILRKRIMPKRHFWCFWLQKVRIALIDLVMTHTFSPFDFDCLGWRRAQHRSRSFLGTARPHGDARAHPLTCRLAHLISRHTTVVSRPPETRGFGTRRFCDRGGHVACWRAQGCPEVTQTPICVHQCLKR